MLIDGKQIASEIFNELKIKVQNLKEKGIIPNLYIILLSNDESSASYVKQKQLRGEEIGVKITLEKADPEISTEELISKINKLNKDYSVHGIIVQRPMPKHLDEEKIEKTVAPEKDVDGFNPTSEFQTPVAMAVLEILRKISNLKFGIGNLELENWLKTKKVTVVGKGLTAGGPIIRSFKKLGIQPEIISSKTRDPKKIIKESDIVISAVGKEKVINKSEIKKGAILIGVGMHRGEDKKFHGDYDEDDIKGTASFYTPVPGGVGPVNVAMLLRNLVSAAQP